MEREGWVESAVMMLGIFMVATEPEAARRRCFFPSWAWEAAVKEVGSAAVVWGEGEESRAALSWFILPTV